jgi:RNA polymerase sigma-70 factor (ECF subfamily)
MTMASIDFDQLVEMWYAPLYRFALSLARQEAQACDLTQQTFYLWATKGHQLRDAAKVKAWLFTTLHREFLGSKRRETRFPHYDIELVQSELPPVTSDAVDLIDGDTVMELLMEIEDVFRIPLVLFYLEHHSYQEIAEILEVPAGTIMSRLSRGKLQLRKLLSEKPALTTDNRMPWPSPPHQTGESHG